MYNANNNLKNYIYSSHVWKAKFGDLEDEILNFRMLSQATADGSISFGGSVSSSVEFTMMYDPNNDVGTGERTLYVGMDLDGIDEWIPLGLFTPTKAQIQNGEITFIAYDRFYSKMSGLYTSNLTYPTDIRNVIVEIGAMTGVPIEMSNIPLGRIIDNVVTGQNIDYDDDGNETVTNEYGKPFDGMTYADAIRMIAQLLGKVAYVNRDGIVVFRWYEKAMDPNSSYIDYDGHHVHYIPADYYYDDYVKCEEEITIDSIIGSNGQDVFSEGNGVNAINILNQFITQTDITSIFNEVKGLKYIPSVISFIGDPRLDLCDIVYVQENNGQYVKFPIMSHELYFDGGLKSTTTSYSVPGKEITSSNQYSSPIGNELASLRQDLGIFKTLITDNIKSVSGNIQDLRGKTLYYDNGYIKNLQGEILAYDKAYIDELEVKKINGHTILNSHILAKALSDTAIETVLGIKVTYSTEDSPPENPSEGDLWYLTVVEDGHERTDSLREYSNGEWISVPLDADVFKANSITAQALSVRDLLAIGATIGGWSIDEEGIYREVLDDDGNVMYISRINPNKITIEGYGDYSDIGKVEIDTHGIKIQAAQSMAAGSIRRSVVMTADGFSCRNFDTIGEVSMSGLYDYVGSDDVGYDIARTGGRVWSDIYHDLQRDQAQIGARLNVGDYKPRIYMYQQTGSDGWQKGIWSINASGAGFGVVDVWNNNSARFNTGSDRRLKENIVSLDESEALSLLKNLEVKNFNYKEDDVTYSGFIAQELRDILKGFGYRGYLSILKDDKYVKDIDEDEANVIYAIDYSKLVPILWKGWQVHEDRIAELERENSKLESRIERLERMIQK